MFPGVVSNMFLAVSNRRCCNLIVKQPGLGKKYYPPTDGTDPGVFFILLSDLAPTILGRELGS